MVTQEKEGGTLILILPVVDLVKQILMPLNNTTPGTSVRRNNA